MAGGHLDVVGLRSSLVAHLRNLVVAKTGSEQFKFTAQVAQSPSDSNRENVIKINAHRDVGGIFSADQIQLSGHLGKRNNNR